MPEPLVGVIMPVIARVSSAVANDTRDTPISRLTLWFTSRRCVASTAQAACFRGSFLDATTMVLTE